MESNERKSFCKITMKKRICFAALMLLLTACLCGCGEGKVNIKNAEQETSGKPGFRDFGRETMPGDFSPMQGLDVSEEDVATLIQTAYDYASSESDLWYIAELTDEDILKELNHKFGNAGNQNREAGFGENGTIPERTGEGKEKPNGDGSERPGNGQFSSQGNTMRPGNMGNGFDSCILMISAMEGSEISAADVMAAVQEAAEAMGYSASGEELTEQQEELIQTQTGYEPSQIVRIGMPMPT